jgi:hypothetical protein
MKFWYLFLAFVVLGPSLGAHNEMRLTPTIPMEMFEDQCNLPGPANLAVTNVGATDLSFSWDGVAGAYAFKVELTKVSTNTVVYSNTTLPQAQFLTISSLEPGTEYRLDVWSMCSATEQGGQSTTSETTHNFILDEVAANYQGTEWTPGYHFQLFPIQPGLGSPDRYFKVKGPQNESIFLVKNVDQQLNGGVHFNHLNSGNVINLVNHNLDSPTGAPGNYVFSFNPGNVIFKTTIETIVLNFSVVKENGYYYLDWTGGTKNGGFEILKASNDGTPGGGGKGKQKNNLQNPKEIDGVEERTESISTDTPCSIRPNPFTDLLTVQGPTPANVQLLDINGKLIYQYTMDTTETQTTIPTADLAKGVYLVRYETADSVKTIKVVKTN